MALGQCCYGAVSDLGGSLVNSATLAAVKVVIATTMICSGSSVKSFLGWLSSRSRLAWKAKPAARTAEQRNDQGSTTNNIVLHQKFR
jgi:hypothetical protein